MICALSYFRGRFVSALRSAAQAGEAHRHRSRRGLGRARYADGRGLGGLCQAQRAVHRVGDRLSGPLHPSHRHSNARILGLDGDKVHLRYRDYHDGEHKTLVLQAAELLRRFLLHVLPKGLMRVRHYGLLANH